MRSTRIGQRLFAIAFASLGIWSLVYGEFPWGEPSLLAGVPGRQALVYGSALVILAASFGLWFARSACPSVVAIAVWLALRAAICVPRILAKPFGFDTWYPFCEALTPLAAAWILYAMLRRGSPGPATRIAGDGAVRAAQILFGLTCVFYGWSHFAYATYTAAMVPAWLPGHLALAYLTGVGHVAAGLAIIIRLLPRLAANLEALMMSSFGLLVWVPSFFAQPRPGWATPPRQQWSELVVTLLLAAAAWIVAISFANCPWGSGSGRTRRSSPS